MPNNQQAIPAETVEAAKGGSIRNKLAQQILTLIQTMPGKWSELSEIQQTLGNQSIAEITGEFVSKLVEQLATDGRTAVPATLESVTIKDNVKAVLIATKDKENINDLGQYTGRTGYFIPHEPGEHMALDPLPVNPDEPPLPGLDPAAAVRARIRIVDGVPLLSEVPGRDVPVPMDELTDDELKEVKAAFNIHQDGAAAQVADSIMAQVDAGSFVPVANASQG